MAPYGAGHERLRLTGFGSFSPLKGGFLAFPLRNSGPCIGFRSPLPPGSRPAPRKVTLGPLAGVALSVMTECWLDLELQMSGPKKGETGRQPLPSKGPWWCPVSFWCGTYHPKCSGSMSTSLYRPLLEDKDCDFSLSILKA